MKLVLKTLTIMIVFEYFSTSIHAQNVAINTTGAAPDPSAALDISSNVRGILIPRMDSAERIALGFGTKGLLVYDYTSKSFWYANGDMWVNIGDAASVPNPLSLASSGTTISGESDQDDESGIYGLNTSKGVAIGVKGVAIYDSPMENSIGVIGQNFSTNGLGYGVMGEHMGTGWGGYFIGNNALKTDGSTRLNGSTELNGITAILGNNTLEFGKGVAGKDPYAGFMGYGILGYPNDLSIYGAGTTLNNRKIRLLSAGGTTVVGPAIVEGNLPVGTPSVPSGYKMSVDGKIIAEELRIQNSTAWPDYVFQKDYPLPSLVEVANHISQKQHLIGVPSAKEVASEGIIVGDMQKVLLKKIEEMTLYILDLQKQINVLKKEVHEK